jgi:outer membrane protein assembly factor BamB
MRRRTTRWWRTAKPMTLAITAALLAACTITPSPIPGTATTEDGLPPLVDVPMYKANAEWSGVHPGPGPVGRPTEVWRTEVGCPVGERTAVVGSGLVLIGCDAPKLFALDAYTGSIRWTAELDASTTGVAGSAAVGNGSAFVADGSGRISSFDLATGDLRWDKALGATGVYGIVDGTLYLSTAEAFVGVDPDDGSSRWTWPVDTGVRYGMVVGDTAFVASQDGIFSAVSLGDREERWRLHLASGSVHSASVDGNTVYVAARQLGPEPTGELYAVDIASGEQRWHFRTQSGFQVGPCVSEAGVLYACSFEDGLFALNGDDGTVIWNVPAPETFPPVAKVGDVLYVFADRALRAYAADDGTQLWEVDLGANTKSGPVVTGGLAILGDEAGVVHAFAEPATARLLPSPDETSEPPATAAASVALTALEEVGMFDAASTELAHPSGMDVGPDGNLYLINAGRSEVLVVAPDGTIVRRWGSGGAEPGQFNFRREPGDPNGDIGGVAVSAKGDVYVADTANRRIQQFDAQGSFVRQWGRFGTGDGQFLDPFDLAVGPDGTVYVVDDQRDDIQAFTADGGFVRTIGEHGTGPGQLNFTGGIFVDTDGQVHNADWSNHRVQAWDSAGTFLWTVGSHGTMPGQLNEPGDVVADAAGRIYVADRLRVQVFNEERQLIGWWESPGPELFNLAMGSDVVYVASPWTDRIYALRLDE